MSMLNIGNENGNLYLAVSGVMFIGHAINFNIAQPLL